MSVKDIKSQLQSNIALNATIVTNTTTNGAIIDNANFDLGIMFIVQCTEYTNGTYNFTIEEGDKSDLSDATIVPAKKLIGDLSDLTITAISASGELINSVGVFSNKRYLRLKAVSTASSAAGAKINALVVQSGEIVPV